LLKVYRLSGKHCTTLLRGIAAYAQNWSVLKT